MRLRNGRIERPVVMATDNGFWVHNILGRDRERDAARGVGVGRERQPSLKLYFQFGRTPSIPAPLFPSTLESVGYGNFGSVSYFFKSSILSYQILMILLQLYIELYV